MSGFGTISFGTGPYGLGTPVSASVPPEGAAGIRYINPATRDYEQDPDTRQLKQMPRARQQVLLALTTLRGSASTLPEFGVRLPRKMGDRFEAETLTAVKTALRHLTDTQKVIRLDRVQVEKGRGGRARITVVYTDTSTGRDDRVTI